MTCPTKLTIRATASELLATAQAKEKKSDLGSLGSLWPWRFSPINWCTQEVELSLLCNMAVCMMLCCMIALLLCNSMTLNRATQSSRQKTRSALFCVSLTESEAYIFQHSIIYSLILILSKHTHSIQFPSLYQEPELFHVTPSLFQNPIFHIFESFSARQWEIELKLCVCSWLAARILMSE
jgi:hypothetical protein